MYKYGLIIKLSSLILALVLISISTASALTINQYDTSINSTNNVNIKKWTILVYLNGDTNDSTGDLSLFRLINEMENVGKSDEINIIVQADDYNLWDGQTKRYEIKKDNNIDKINSIVVDSDTSEKDMANPNTLVNFVNWATNINNYPAENYALFMTGHGNGWRELSPDHTNRSVMYIDGLENALEQIKDRLGKKLDILIFYSCLMSTIEVYYQIKDSVEICIGSEQKVPTSDLSFEYALENLKNHPNYNSSEFAKSIVDGSTSQPSYEGPHMHFLLGVYMNRINKIKDYVNYFANNRIDRDSNNYLTDSLIKSAYQNSHVSTNHNIAHKPHDIYYMIDSFQTMFFEPYEPEGILFCEQAKDYIEESVIYPSEIENHIVDPKLKGLAITLTKSKSDFKIMQHIYEDLDFAKDTSWDEFLFSYDTSSKIKINLFTSFFEKLFSNNFIKNIF